MVVAAPLQNRAGTSAREPGSDGAGADADDTCNVHDLQASELGELVATIEGEVIPRLMLAHQSLPEAADAAALDIAPPSADDIAELVDLVLVDDDSLARGFVNKVLDRGVPIEVVYLQLLSPAARRLGELWEADHCTFSDVTIGIWHLHRLMHELGAVFGQPLQQAGDSRRCLMTAVPGEQHTFGVFMVAEFFRRDGWYVYDAPSATQEELADLVRSQPFDVVGLSASGNHMIENITDTIANIREHCCNRHVTVMVGGKIFEGNPDLVAAVGADATAHDAREAPQQAERLVRLRLGPA